MPRCREFGTQTLRTRLRLERIKAAKSKPKKRRKQKRINLIYLHGRDKYLADLPFLLHAIEIETDVDRVLISLPVKNGVRAGLDPEIVLARKLLVYCAKRYLRITSEALGPECCVDVKTVTVWYREYRLRCSRRSISWDEDFLRQTQRVWQVFSVLRAQARAKKDAE